jgi:beta-lactam-binding protein with PASTA domain
MTEDNWYKTRKEIFEPFLPLIPGTVVTLIGIVVWLLDKVNGTIFCYFGVMGMIVAGGYICIQNVAERPDLDAHKKPDHKHRKRLSFNVAGRHAQIQNVILVACCVLGAVVTGLAIVCVATLTTFKGGMAPGLFAGLASLFSGGFVGFLFSIPNENQRPNSSLLLNTSLNQIADWLTKIIVGVSLVNAQTAYTYFAVAAKTLGAGLEGSGNLHQAAVAFAAGLIVTFFFLGFTGTYLLTRLWITGAIVLADQLALEVATGSGIVVAVPKVDGLTQDDAATAIKAAKLALGTVTQKSSDTVPSGTVISQDPASGSSASEGSPVNLVISSGAQQAVAVPKVDGLTQDDATAAIKAAKLAVGTVTQKSSDTVASGTVISQDPANASSASEGSSVNLVISSGVQQAVAVPKVDGLTQDDATTAIKAAKLAVGTVTQKNSDTVPSGTVISQDPASGSSASEGSPVNLVISSGAQQPVAVPKVDGLTQDDATTAIKAVKFTVGIVTQKSSDSVPSGTVISQDPASASSASEGSPVNLVISSGP